MLVIKVPATSGNLGPGFDIFGISYELYNAFGFLESDEYKVIGFEKKYTYIANNLIIKSYESLFKKLNKEIKKVSIYALEKNVPSSRGLGSSATCIIAGLFAANFFLGNPLTKEELFQEAVKLEGHPDNVAPAIFGSFRISILIDNYYYTEKYMVNKDYRFFILYPDFSLSTSLARSVLPKEVTYRDVNFNLSRVCLLPKYLENGDLEKLRETLQDKLHQPYRYPLIKDSDKILAVIDEYKVANCISGAGPSLLIISKDALAITALKSKPFFKGWHILEMKLDNKGVIIGEE